MPMRRRYRDSALSVDALAGYGFHGLCKCGWRGKRCGTVKEAQAALSAHIAEAHP